MSRKEVEANVPTPDTLREALESVSRKQITIVKRVSVRARIRSIRNAHVARCGTIFFKKNKSGGVVFLPRAGKSFMQKLFLIPHKRVTT